MKGDRIEIEDEWYLDTTAAAEKTGYTKDYVGQLARGGKIKARQLGRAWYVHEASLLAHKKEVYSSDEEPARAKSKKTPTKKNTTAAAEKKQKTDTATSKKKVTIPPSDAAHATGSVSDRDTDAVDTVLADSPVIAPAPQKKVCTEVLVKKNTVTVAKDPLIHTNISFHPDGPVEYQAGSVSPLPQLNKISDTQDIDRYGDMQNGRTKNALHTERSVVTADVCIKKSTHGGVVAWWVQVPYTVSVGVGLGVGCLIALVSLL
jgi:hypothetical protein